MRILGIDFGDRSIGLALSDRLLLTAQPLGRYQIKGLKEDKKYFQDLVARQEIEEIVVGLPLRMDGTQGTRAQRTKEFASWLEKILNLPVILWDERLSTKQALRILSQNKIRGREQKKFKDQISATIILSSYLESKRA